MEIAYVETTPFGGEMKASSVYKPTTSNIIKGGEMQTQKVVKCKVVSFTKDTKKTETRESIKVTCVPLWKFLLHALSPEGTRGYGIREEIK